MDDTVNNQIVGSSVPERLNEDQEFDVAVVRFHPTKIVKGYAFPVNGVLSESAVVWLLGSNDEGIKSLPKTAEDFIQTVETIDIRQRARLLEGDPRMLFERWQIGYLWKYIYRRSAV